MGVVFFQALMAECAESDEIIRTMICTIKIHMVHMKHHAIFLRRPTAFSTLPIISFNDLWLDTFECITVNSYSTFFCSLFVKGWVLPILPSCIFLRVGPMLGVEKVSLTPPGQNVFITQYIISNIGSFGLYGNFFRVLFSPDYSVADFTQTVAVVLMPCSATKSACGKSLSPLTHRYIIPESSCFVK